MTNPRYRNRLPIDNGNTFLTDGGLETSLIFHDGFDLPLFAAFTLLRDKDGRQALQDYLVRFCEIARSHGTGFILDTPTWRASQRWADELGYSEPALKAAHDDAVEMLVDLRDRYDRPEAPFLINGVLGPQDDGYNPEQFMSALEAEAYHSVQARYFDEAGVDMVSAITMTYVEEAIGIANAAKARGIPSVISFTVETDGRLPSGQALGDAIEQVDRETDNAPVYYMINCAHPDHFADTIAGRDGWLSRIRGVRANASRMSHEELDNATELDDGNPVELGASFGELSRTLPNLTVMGGCCGTDHRHIEAMAGNRAERKAA